MRGRDDRDTVYAMMPDIRGLPEPSAESVTAALAELRTSIRLSVVGFVLLLLFAATAVWLTARHHVVLAPVVFYGLSLPMVGANWYAWYRLNTRPCPRCRQPFMSVAARGQWPDLKKPCQVCGFRFPR